MYTCPVTTVAAPVGTVWPLLVEPANYRSWVDAEVVAVDPPGPLRAGQVLSLRTSAAGRSWPVRWDVLEVDPAEHRMALDIRLPFGIVNHEVITCRATSEERTFVAFG